MAAVLLLPIHHILLIRKLNAFIKKNPLEQKHQ